MDDNQHSPAPWDLYESVLLSDNGRKQIAYITDGTSLERPIRKADRLLIQAAPDLLSALLTLRQNCTFWQAMGVNIDHAAMVLSEQAIKRATGT
jgi:hypothetical protein